MAIIAHIDMDCFFCSCEEKYQPELKGKPVIIGGISERGVVSSANYEARTFGVHSAMPGWRAQQLCPQGNFLPGNMKLYKEESRRVMGVLRRISDEFVQASIDEAYLELSDFSKEFSSLQEMAHHIRILVKEETGLSCSIGLANCKVTAKIASDMNKPDGCMVVNDQKSFLAPLHIKKVPGIGKKSVKKYFEKGMYTIGDLAQANVFTLLDIGGLHAVKYQQIAAGERRVLLKKQESKKSVSTEHTFSRDTQDNDFLHKTIDELCEKIYPRVKGSYFKTISIKLRYNNFQTLTRDFSLHTMTNSLDMIKSIAHSIFEENYNGELAVRLIGVKMSNFIKEPDQQTTLEGFTEPATA